MTTEEQGAIVNELTAQSVKIEGECCTWLNKADAFVQTLPDKNATGNDWNNTHDSNALCRVAKHLHHLAQKYAPLEVAHCCTVPGQPKHFTKSEVLRNIQEFQKAVKPTAPAGRLKGIPFTEAEVRVREWLAANAKADPANITRDAVAVGAGVSSGQVSKTAAWKAFRERRDSEAKPGAREVPLTDPMQAAMPSDCERPDEIAALIEEQKKEEAEQERRHKRRHRPS
jgi:hypothetical protein